MARTVKMDGAGRVVIPRTIREKYGLVRGSHRVEVLESPDGIVLRPTAETIPAERHASGWVVFRSGRRGTVDPARAILDERERRHRQIRGEE